MRDWPFKVMQPTLPRFNDPVKRVTMDPEEPNTCVECGTRTDLIENGPQGEYMIERCPACGQLHHFYPEED